ncbi:MULTISPECIES: M48 family metallopeptidase [unclassified Moorena]|uniref:M48 family metallopeptidase n=1 Tax=unclassified Moorena TaxID=2683338 RepID=UPI0013B82D90|nr:MULTISPECIES: M48 family metallopeptidase [unclassified Moorena]NEP34616.1 M48 family metalloprotease [Moorena sp. SIO3B2]NER85925.1 M48 family metalloprotease [Moorena sp. SIO3A2]NES43282.1 M48 family metalloprotease [Moorena sp. SIO2C4]NES83296.1 M48 family metalloprotease [Moorena sp. SIO2B7]
MRRLILRLGIAFIVGLFGLISYFTSVSENPVTGEKQRIQLSPRQEVVIGLQARGQMAAQHGGLYPDQALQGYISQVGEGIVKKSAASGSPYPFEFYLLSDPRTVNAFALPGGQIFLTLAMLRRLNTEAQLAGVLGHEIGHVVGRHGAEHLAKQKLGVALVNAVGIAASDDAQSGRQAALLAQAINQMVSLKYGREDELESDRLGFRFMTQAGYNPRGIVELMQVLNSIRQGGQPPEFFSTHPNPSNRIEQLQSLIAKTYPNGIPLNLQEGRERFARNVKR